MTETGRMQSIAKSNGHSDYIRGPISVPLWAKRLQTLTDQHLSLSVSLSLFSVSLSLSLSLLPSVFILIKGNCFTPTLTQKVSHTI